MDIISEKHPIAIKKHNCELCGCTINIGEIMKKIMFNDKYGLTQAVLEGRKTITRRIDKSPKYQVGEEVAIAQSYSSILDDENFDWVGDTVKKFHAGWKNKMFVRAELMPHRIKITNVRKERLQDISDEDCLKEGLEIVYYGNEIWYKIRNTKNGCVAVQNPIEAFARIIDKISGKGTWDENPYVFVYEFKLIK